MPPYMQSALLLILLFNGHQALNWNTRGPKDGSTIYACVGDDVRIPWEYDKDPGDEVNAMNWYFTAGDVKRKIALFSNGGFTALPAYNNRVAQEFNGGLQLSHVTVADTGKYRVSMAGSDAAGNYKNFDKSVTLEVADDLYTSDGRLHVDMAPSAYMNETSNTYSAEMLCGRFKYQYQPSFDVKWTTPSGAVRVSNYFKDGHFSLILPRKIEGGKYTCEVAAQTPNSCTQKFYTASVVVDATDATLAVMESRLAAGETERRLLKANMTAERTRLDAKLSAERKDTVEKFAEAEAERNSLEESLDTNFADRKKLESEVHAQAGALSYLQGRSSSSHVWFQCHTLIKSQLNRGDQARLSFCDSSPSQGVKKMYDDTTGLFTAPVTGHYFFMATTGPSHDGNFVGLEIVQGDNKLAHTRTSTGTGTAHTATHLIAGQTVGLTATNTGTYTVEVSYFTGFLIAPGDKN